MCGKPDFKPVKFRVEELMGNLPQDCTAILSVFAGGVFWETPQEFAGGMRSGNDERLCVHRLERLLEVRAYSDTGELHVWRDAIGTKARLHGRNVCDKGISADYYMDEEGEGAHFLDIDVPRSKAIRKQTGNDCLYKTTGGGRYVLPGPDYTKVRIRNYLDYDEDGICRVVDFRILGLSRGRKTLEPMMLEDLLREKSEDLNQKLGWKRTHPTSQGDLSEYRWRKFLKSFLPSRYAVTKGFVFDSKGGRSEQIDVIVYDPFYSVLIRKDDNGERYVTAESVYAVFEVKQRTNKSTIEEASKKIESVRKLERTSRGTIASGQYQPPRVPGTIIGGLLAADIRGETSSINTIKQHIASHDHKLNRIDIVCSAQLGTFHTRCKVNNDIEVIEDIVVSSPEESVFAFFYALLDELYRIGTVPGIEIADYAERSLKSFRLKKDEPKESQ